jgi:hypothetical protein
VGEADTPPSRPVSRGPLIEMAVFYFCCQLLFFGALFAFFRGPHVTKAIWVLLTVGTSAFLTSGWYVARLLLEKCTAVDGSRRAP